MADPAVHTELPIACTLDAESGAVRIGRWRALIDTAGRGSELVGGRLEVRFRADSEVAGELAELVVAERMCCAFLSWDVTPATDELVLTVTGDHEQLAVLGCLGG